MDNIIEIIGEALVEAVADGTNLELMDVLSKVYQRVKSVQARKEEE